MVRKSDKYYPEATGTSVIWRDGSVSFPDGGDGYRLEPIVEENIRENSLPQEENKRFPLLMLFLAVCLGCMLLLLTAQQAKLEELSVESYTYRKIISEAETTVKRNNTVRVSEDELASFIEEKGMVRVDDENVSYFSVTEEQWNSNISDEEAETSSWLQEILLTMKSKVSYAIDFFA